MFEPTAEQQRALELFRSGDNLAIEAGAGTGKTATLLLLARDAEPRNLKGQYIAFNRAIVKEAGQKFPGTVNASTAHSLAFRAVGHDYADRMRNSARMRSIDIANRVRIDALRVTSYDGEQKLLSQGFLAGLAMRGTVRFCQSDADAPTRYHVPVVPGLDKPGEGRGPVNTAVGKALLPALKRIWQDWTNPEGGLPYRHDAYLKLWQLSEPRIGADYILFDECQDANPVMAAIVFAQTHAQLVFVGDSQQQIYAFTGAVNSLARIRETGCNTAFLTQSFRFGPAVAEVANGILSNIEDAELRLTGTPTINSVVGPVDAPDCVLTRTNAAAVRTVLEGLRDEKRVALVGGADDIVRFAKAARQLMQGERTDHPELACFESWNEVCTYVDEDEQGSELRLNVKLVNEFGVETILEALDTLAGEGDADLVVSTAHKSKGREWDSVRLGPDFPEEQTGADELRLLYVACTRARHNLDVTMVKFIRDGFQLTEQAAPVATTAAAARVAAAPVETVTAPVSEHVGAPGETLELELRVEHQHGMTTRFGWTYLSKFVDADGNQFKAFMDEELTEGATYAVRAKVKEHGEFRGVKETTVNYVTVGEQVTA